MALFPHIIQEFDSPVWRMEIDEENDILCVETRNAADKTTLYTSVDLSTGKLYFKNMALPEGWQCGLAAAANGIMLVNGYQSEILPISKGLTAIDIKTGEQLWANYNFNLERVQPLGLQVYDMRIHPKHIMLVSERTGMIIPNLEKDKMPVSDIKYPGKLSPVVLPNITGLPTAEDESVSFVEHNGYRMVSLHSRSEGLFTQHLFVLGSNNNIVFKDIILRDIQKLQPEAFIIYKDKLIWLQNRSVLKVLDL